MYSLDQVDSLNYDSITSIGVITTGDYTVRVRGRQYIVKLSFNQLRVVRSFFIQECSCREDFDLYTLYLTRIAWVLSSLGT